MANTYVFTKYGIPEFSESNIRVGGSELNTLVETSTITISGISPSGYNLTVTAADPNYPLEYSLNGSNSWVTSGLVTSDDTIKFRMLSQNDYSSQSYGWGILTPPESSSDLIQCFITVITKGDDVVNNSPTCLFFDGFGHQVSWEELSGDFPGYTVGVTPDKGVRWDLLYSENNIGFMDAGYDYVEHGEVTSASMYKAIVNDDINLKNLYGEFYVESTVSSPGYSRLCLNVVDKDNFICLEVTSDAIKFGDIANGEWVQNTVTISRAFEPGLYRIEHTYSTGEIKVYLNGQLLEYTPISCLVPSGGYGLASKGANDDWNTYVYIDWVEFGYIEVPATPVALDATNITTTSFTSNWILDSSVTTYYIVIATDTEFSSSSTILSTEVGFIDYYDVTSLDPNTPYYYYVYASNGQYNSENSNIITVTTLDDLTNDPEAEFSPSKTTAIVNEYIRFTYTGNAQCTVRTFLWDFGDGTTSTEKNVVHRYTEPGVYTVTLTVNCDNTIYTASHNIVIISISEFTISNGGSALVNTNVDFTNTGNGDGSVEQCHNKTYLWNFGDGTTSTEQNPTHIYTEVGTYIVTLTINCDSIISTTTHSIEIVTELNPKVKAYSGAGTYIKIE